MAIFRESPVVVLLKPRRACLGDWQPDVLLMLTPSIMNRGSARHHAGRLDAVELPRHARRAHGRIVSGRAAEPLTQACRKDTLLHRR